jgi:hypothetical protein
MQRPIMNQAKKNLGRINLVFGPEKYDFHRYKRLLWKKMALKWSQMFKNKNVNCQISTTGSRRVAKYKKIVNFLKTFISVL